MIKEKNKIESLGKEKGTTGSGASTGFTIFKNHDEELVAKIKAVTLDEKTFVNGFNETCTIVSEDEDGQILCINESEKKKKFFIDKEELEEYRERNLMDKINRLYPVHKHFADNFGTIFGDKTLTIIGSDDEDLGYDDLGKVGYSESDFGLDVTKDSISICKKNSKWSSIMFCHFNKDGNYVNRDYNIDLARYAKAKTPLLKEVISKIEESIPDITYLYDDNKWFSDKFVLCFEDYSKITKPTKGDFDIDDDQEETIIGFELKKEVVRENGTYGNKSTKKAIKIVKNAIKVDRSHIMDVLLPIIKQMDYPE